MSRRNRKWSRQDAKPEWKEHRYDERQDEMSAVGGQGSEENDDELVAALIQGFDQMDSVILHPQPPHMREMEALVSAHKQKIRERNRLETVGFFVVALVIIGGNIALALNNLHIFGIVQGCVLIAVLGFAARSVTRSKRKADSNHAR